VKILVFLGNPGSKYSRTRHNIGFMAGEKFAELNNIQINKKNFLSETGTGKIEGVDVLLLFPQTFMNESGKAVKKAMDFYREKHSSLIVFHDELELKFGDVAPIFTGFVSESAGLKMKQCQYRTMCYQNSIPKRRQRLKK